MALTIRFPSVNGTSTYRSLERQIQMFDGTDPVSRTSTEGRYIPEPLWGTFAPGVLDPDDERSWKGQRWRRRKSAAEASVPGKSNHGLGLAVDFDNGQIGSYLDWLRTHAAAFGFDEENSTERWHWRYHAGDDLPAAVTLQRIEPPRIDPLVIDPPLEEDNMRIVDVNFGSSGFARVVVSDHVRWVRGPAVSAFDKLAVPKFQIEPDELVGLMQTLGTAGPSPFSGAFGNALPDAELDAAWSQALR
jgi:hypothetical protein